MPTSMSRRIYIVYTKYFWRYQRGNQKP